jgi:enoyl-CoA hydratase/carnithine racemase
MSDKELENSGIVDYTIPVEETLFDRVEKIIDLLNASDDQKHTKQSWLVDAILKKISKERIDMAYEPSKVRHLRFSIKKGLYEKIDKTVKTLRRSNKSYTKTQWFIEAVNEKLEQEERKAKKLLVKFRDLASSKKSV